MKVYAGAAHPHEAQQPKPVNLLKARNSMEAQS
jgi:ribosomal protein L13